MSAHTSASNRILTCERNLFMEKFALQLAVELLGPDRVVQYLDGGDKRVPLYWRSKLMVSDPSGILYHFGEHKDSAPGSTDSHLPKVLFFDVAFNFSKKQQQQQQEQKRNQQENVKSSNDISLTQSNSSSSCNALVTLGVFLLLPSAGRDSNRSEENKDRGIGGGHYVSTRPLDHSQIMAHIDSLQLDPQSVTADALARSMAGEFLRQGPSSSKNEAEPMDQNQHLTAKYVYPSIAHASTKKEENADENNTDKRSLGTHSHSFDSPTNNCDIRLDIPYQSIGSTKGALLLICSGADGVTKYDRVALRLLYWDFSKNANHYHPPKKSDESSISPTRQLVEEAFDRWRTQIVSTTDSNSGNAIVHERDKATSNRGIQCSSGNVLPTAAGSSSAHNQNNNQKRKVFRGASILPSARRKRSRGLVYDKSL